MKMLCLLLCIIIIFCSCAASEALTLPLDTDAEFTDGTITVKGRLYFDGEKMSFLTDGYKVTITKEGGEIEYDGIVFRENVIPSSRFLPLYDLLCSKGRANSSCIEKGDLKITFLKDTK